MQIVIDANIIIAMLIRPGKPIDMFFDSRISLVAPALLFTELENNSKTIINKSNLTEEEYRWLLVILKNNVTIIPEIDILPYREKSEEICPDPKDIVYFALALYLNCSIWSNEKKLKDQNIIKVYATHGLMRVFEV